MSKISPQLDFFLRLARVNALVARSFNRGLGSGIGFNDFIILYHLSLSKEGTMRRVDLAEKVALTASGITRLLLPMEKIGLVKREGDPADLRVSLVRLAPGGKRLLLQAIEDAEHISKDFLPNMDARMEHASDVFKLFSMGQI